MKVRLTLTLALVSLYANAQVGIGTTTPLARLHVVDSNVLFSASGDISPTAAPPISGAGRRMMWYPAKAAFRAGYVGASGSAYWDMANIGNYSFATGNNTRATGNYSFAAGNSTTANGIASTAFGAYSTASAENTFAVNGAATAEGAIALGSGAQATGNESISIGFTSLSAGLGSVAMGPSSATGAYSLAFGLSNRVSGNFSVAIGKNASVSHQGSCVIGDASAGFTSDSVYSSANNEMTMRYIGGYRLFTTLGLTSGVTLAGGGGSWASVSDRRKKENFRSVNAEDILKKVAALPVTNWNYKAQPQSQRHIGPMAQDFYAAFQLDGIGNDTTINNSDIDGVNMAAIQALEKRTTELRKENETLRAELKAMNDRMAAMERLVMDKKTYPELTASK